MPMRAQPPNRLVVLEVDFTRMHCIVPHHSNNIEDTLDFRGDLSLFYQATNVGVEIVALLT